MQHLPEGVQFSESPRSPLHRSRSRRKTSPMHKPTTQIKKCEFVGSISAVNEQLSTDGLLRQPQAQPLISELSKTQLVGSVSKDFGVQSELPVENAALVERYSFPGYSATMVTPLPHQLNVLLHMEMVTKAQKSFKTKHKFLKCWRECFYSPPSRDIFVDTFWWFFLDRYQPQRKVQDLLFARVAVNYIELLTNVDQLYSDFFFKVYSDILAQCIYSAFVHAFPTSWSSFDEDFKTLLCSMIYQWILGIKPLPDIWKSWNIEELEPKNLMRHVSKKSEKKSVSTVKNFDLESLVANALKQEKADTGLARADNFVDVTKARERRRSSSSNGYYSKGIRKLSASKSQPTVLHKYNQLESLALTIKGPQFEHAVMDISCNSPLVQYFLHHHGLYHQQQGYSLLIQHTDLMQQPDAQANPTYRKIIRESQQQSRQMKDTFEKAYKMLKEQMYRKERERALSRRNHSRDLRVLMRHAREVRTLSNFLAVNQLCEQPETRRKAKAMMVITDAIKRIS